MKNLKIIILAAGKSRRFLSQTPKVGHLILGKPLINYVIDAGRKLSENIFTVVGDNYKKFENIIYKDIHICLQKEALGTADAVKAALDTKKINKNNDILILCSDTPNISSKTLKKFFNFYKKNKLDCAVLSFKVENAFGYGRIVRQKNKIKAIVEEKDADEKVKQIKEVNSGIYLIKNKVLSEYIKKIKNKNQSKEYYLTDIISILIKNNLEVSAYKAKDAAEFQGINNRKEFIQASNIIQKKIIDRLIEKGITIVSTETTFISPDAKIEKDVIIEPNVYIYGNTKIKPGCIIGPGTYINNSYIGRNCKIFFSKIDTSEIKNNVNIGPYSNIRPGTQIGNNCKIGNFVEIKKSTIADNTKVSHLSYIGDSELGKNVNIGAGTITCNYDGKNKHKTIIKDNVFVGSDTQFIAPVTIEKNALIAAGSSITDNVPEFSLAIARQKQVVYKDWVKKNKKR